MRGKRRAIALSVSVLVFAQLLYNPAGHAQATPESEPEVQAQGTNVAPPPPPPGPPPLSGPVVILRADNPRARLQTQGPLKWTDVCMAPCRVPVNPSLAYRIGGGPIRPSETFNLPRQSGSVVIDTHVGSTVKHWVGLALILVGALDILGGALSYKYASDLSSSNSGIGSKEYYQTTGVTGMITGVVLIAIGIPFSLSSTSVEVR
jgi:hypothetical protein